MKINCVRCNVANTLDEGADLTNAYCGSCFAPLSPPAQAEIAQAIEHNRGEIKKFDCLKMTPEKPNG